MKRTRYLIMLIVITILCGMGRIIYAHPTQKEHDDELKAVLFRDHALTKEQKERFQAIADAAALCIDQFSTNENIQSKKDLFDKLNKRIGFSFSFNDIELQKGSNGKNVTANTHRRYTHRGWNFDSYPFPKLWEQRKKILTATVNKELFNKSPGILAKLPFGEGVVYSEKACNKKCEAFCELVYYVHILGDHLEANQYSDEFSQLIPLVRHEDPRSPAMINELISLANILFADQKNRLIDFNKGLEEMKEDAEKAMFPGNGINLTSEEQFEVSKRYALGLMEYLKKNIPEMLYKVDFIKTAFYE